MADRTGIEWTDATWNPLRGCTRVSEGCLHCYAETMAARFSDPGMPYHGIADRTRPGSKWTGRVELVHSALDQPLRWQRPRRIFVNSMSDLFHDAVPIDWIDAIFGIMALAPQHTYQILTKRADRMWLWSSRARDRSLNAAHCVAAANIIAPHLSKRWPMDARRSLEADHTSWPLQHVWLGVSVENQATASDRVPVLLETAAARRFVSAEPLLGPVRLAPWLVNRRGGRPNGWTQRIDWVIAGGESGHGARPMHPDWARSLRDQCVNAATPFFFKQWGDYYPLSDLPPPYPGAQPLQTRPYPDGTTAVRLGKRECGIGLDGHVWQELPA